MVEKSLVFIKPDGVRKQLIGQVISRFERRGIKVKGLRMLTLTSEMADAHYQEHVERPFYPSLKKYVTGGEIVAMVLEAENVIGVIRKMVGATDSAAAEPGTIRGDFALTKQENIIHASDSPESSEREVKLFFPELS